VLVKVVSKLVVPPFVIAYNGEHKNTKHSLVWVFTEHNSTAPWKCNKDKSN